MSRELSRRRFWLSQLSRVISSEVFKSTKNNMLNYPEPAGLEYVVKLKDVESKNNILSRYSFRYVIRKISIFVTISSRNLWLSSFLSRRDSWCRRCRRVYCFSLSGVEVCANKMDLFSEHAVVLFIIIFMWLEYLWEVFLNIRQVNKQRFLPNVCIPHQFELAC